MPTNTISPAMRERLSRYTVKNSCLYVHADPADAARQVKAGLARRPTPAELAPVIREQLDDLAAADSDLKKAAVLIRRLRTLFEAAISSGVPGGGGDMDARLDASLAALDALHGDVEKIVRREIAARA